MDFVILASIVRSKPTAYSGWAKITRLPLAQGTRLGPYEVLHLIGSGSMGEVYKARDTWLDRAVAIKASRQQFEERFAREARAVAAVSHPGICTLFDVGPITW